MFENLSSSEIDKGIIRIPSQLMTPFTKIPVPEDVQRQIDSVRKQGWLVFLPRGMEERKNNDC